MPKTVGVAVSNATFHFDKLYTYAVMPDQQDTVKLGSMVLVPFGRGSRARMGVVLACDAEPESAKLKYLFDVAPASACLTPELLRLVHFLKERTFCTYYEAVKAVIPYGAQYKPTVAEDGIFGRGTQAAVLALQRKLGIDPTDAQIDEMARRCLEACGSALGSAKKLSLDDMIAIYHAANH